MFFSPCILMTIQYCEIINFESNMVTIIHVFQDEVHIVSCFQSLVGIIECQRSNANEITNMIGWPPRYLLEPDQ
jgi:hypothetical protein